MIWMFRASCSGLFFFVSCLLSLGGGVRKKVSEKFGRYLKKSLSLQPLSG